MVWRSRIITISLLKVMIFTSLISCQSVQKDINNEGKEFNKMDKYKEVLVNNGFIFPSKKLFIEKNNYFFNLIDVNVDKDIELIPKGSLQDETTFFPVAICENEKFIYWDQDEEWSDLSFYNLNNYIFYNDRNAFNYLKLHESNGYLIYLVQLFGFEKDKELLEYIFNKIDNNLYDNFSFSIFYGRNGINGRWELRKDLLLKYLTYNPDVDISLTNFIETIINEGSEDYVYSYEGDRFTDTCFLLDLILTRYYKSNPAYLGHGVINSVFDNNDELLKFAKDQNMYSEIKKYANELYLPCNERETGNGFECEEENEDELIGATQNSSILKGTIKDSDGYVNLRDSRGTYGNVIEKIKNGEEIIIKNQEGNWWLIESTAGESGFVHKSRIVLNK